MKNKAFLLSIFSLVLAITFISLASAGLNNPATGGTITGTYVLNATNSTGLDEMVNCSFYAKSASTANSTWNLLQFEIANDTNARVNTTFDSTILEDSNDYIFNATCKNSTNDVAVYTSTGVIIQNTVPQAPSLSPSNTAIISSATTQTFTGTVVDANTTGCTYAIGRGGTSGTSADTTTGTAVYSATTCTFTKTFSTSGDNGVWYWTMTPSDGTDTSEAGGILNVQITPSNGGVPSGTQVTSDGKLKLGGNPLLILLLIAGGIVVVILIIKAVRK